MQCSTLVRIMKQDRHPIDFDTAGSGEMAVLALVLGLEGPLLTTIMLKQGASLVMALGVLLLPVAIILPLVWVLWRPWPSRWLFEPLQEDAEVRTMQSLVGFNHCVRLATDRYGVHATLNRPFRWLQGSPSLFLGQRSRGKNKGPSGSSPTLAKPWLRGGR